MSTETDPEILYHYCSNDAFLKIVGGNSIWLSDLTSSNDSEEWRWAKKSITSYIENKKITDFGIDDLARHMDLLSAQAIPLGFCLSSGGDILSQWRSYADNGAGVAIGFSKKFLDDFSRSIEPLDVDLGTHEINGKLLQVIYTDSEYHSEIQDVLDEWTYKVRDAGTGPIDVADLFAGFKNKAFDEENEWRVVWICTTGLNNNSSSVGHLPYLKFRATHDRIIPYREVSFKKPKEVVSLKTSPIRKVVLGPRNNTPINVVQGFMESEGYRGVTILPSTASYR